MADNRSETSRYQSQYGGGYVTASQYLVECLCVLIARKEKIQLPNKFWNEQRWQRFWPLQSKHLSKILDEYHPEVVLEALRDRRCWKIQSFGARYILDPILKEKQKVFDQRKQEVMNTEQLANTSTTNQPRKPMANQSMLSKLKGL